jgi:hypothetical protein
MRENELRKVLLVKAVEEHGGDAALLTPADRAAAAREAMRAVPAGEALASGGVEGEALPRRAQGLLVARADALLQRIEARHPFVAQVLAMLGPSSSAMLALVLVALAAGAGLSVLDGSHRINVLAFPLLGIVAWNLAVYAWLLARALSPARARAAPRRAALASLASGVASRTIARSRSFNAPLSEALHAFSREWMEAARPLLLARAARAFHVAAAAVGVGLIGGLYLRGIAFDYRAGWESTFLDAHAARWLLGMLYGPASWLTGLAIPDVAQLEAARWRPDGGGEPAARWIHLMAATALLYVVVPRALLAIFAALKAVRLAWAAPLPASLPAHFRTAFAAVEGAVARARAIVMPFACELSPAALARLIAWIPGAAGGTVDIEARDGIPYGEEERFLAEFASRGGEGADIVVMPFSLATTPEDENHGTVLAGVRQRMEARPQSRLVVVIDEAPYAERMGGAPERIAQRREAWRRFVEAHGLQPVFLSLA